jgi:hypothetical protein
MQNRNIKLSLYIQHHNIDGVIPFSVTPTTVYKIEDGLEVYEFLYDPAKEFEFTVQISDHQCSKSYVEIVKVLGGTYDLTNTSYCYVYTGPNKETYTTYNYLSRVGKYTVKIRYSPMTHHYMMYLYDLCFKKEIS